MLAREAHQLREETADDAVLAADIADTDYAQLLVGVARHECPGLLLGAHGVAPSKSSLARRVARVLDVKSVRGPAAGSFALGVFVGAVVVAAPLAALTLRPAHATEETAAAKAAGKHDPAPYYPPHGVASDLPHIIAQGVSTSVATAVAAVKPVKVVTPVAPVTAVSPNGAVAVSYADAKRAAAIAVANAELHRRRIDQHQRRDSAIDRAVELKAVGATADYVASIRSVAPQIRLSHDDIVQLAGLGVQPDFIQELARAGYRDLSADQISGAYAVGVRSDYIRGMAAAGFPRISLEQLTEMRAVGITPADVERFRRAGFKHLDVDELVEAKTLGLTPEEIRASQRDDP
jgi:hypothetical protein